MPEPPDGQGKLIRIHFHVDFPLFLIDLHAGEFRRSQRIGHVGGEVVGEMNNIDFFAPQLADDGLYPGAPQPHAGAHRIHVGIVGAYGDLGPAAGFPRRVHDFHDAVVDFGHLEIE